MYTMSSGRQINPNEIYTYDQLKEIFLITKRTLSSFVENGELRPVVFGNKYRFLGSEVLRFVNNKIEQDKNRPYA